MLREQLLQVDYSKLTEDVIEEHCNDLYQHLKTIEQLKWLSPKYDVK